jgi:hypothetical protein
MSDDLPVRRNAVGLPVPLRKRRRHEFRLQDDAPALHVGDPTLFPVPSNRELGTRKEPRLVDIRIVGDRLEVVEILAAKEQHSTIGQLEVEVKTLVLEFLDTKRSGDSELG